MPLRSTIAMFAIAVITLVMVMVFVFRSENRVIASERQPLLTIRELPADEVVEIELHRARFDPMRFTWNNGDWQQTEPFDFPVDAFSMRSIIDAALSLEVYETVNADAEEIDLSSLALYPPETIIRFYWGEDQQLGLELGRFGIAGRAYLRKEGEDRIYIVDQRLHERAVRMDPREWRDRRLFAGVPAELDRIAIDLPNETMAFQREARQWKMTEPANTRISTATWSEFLPAMLGASASGFVLDMPDNLDLFGLDDPVVAINVKWDELTETDGDVTRQPRERTLLIGAPAGSAGPSGGDRFAMVEGRDTVMRISGSTLQRMLRNARSFIDLTATGVDPADVKRIRIHTDDHDFTVERQLETWIAPDYTDQQLRIAAVEELLNQLSSVQSVELPRLQPFPKEQQVGYVTLIGFDSLPLDTIRIARDSDTNAWIMDNGDNVLRIYQPQMQVPLNPQMFGLSIADASAQD